MSRSPAATFAQLATVRRPTSTPVHFDRAVVLGGSVAGLLAARVLADHARTVVVIEKDDAVRQLRDGERPGVAHGAQAHTLQPGGRDQLERWFPGFIEEARDGGAVTAGFVSYVDGEAQLSGGATILTCSRPMLEALIRRRTLALPNVQLITGQVTGLGYQDDAVRQVRYRTESGDDVVDADFVVDAMGRSTRLPDWLETDGWQTPELDRVPARVNYATAVFERTEEHPEIGVAAAFYGHWSRDQGTGLLNAVEGGRWLLVLSGQGDDRPSRTPEDFRARALRLPPAFTDVAKEAMLGEVTAFHYADSRRRNFIAAERFPARLVSVGDAAASFNPIFGQGVSTAALQASCLSDYLRHTEDPTAVAREFFALQKVIVDAAWQVSTVGDLAREKAQRRAAEGAVDRPKPVKVRLARWLRRQINRAAAVDHTLAAHRDNVIFMTAHPSTLASPRTVARALAVNLLVSSRDRARSGLRSVRRRRSPRRP